MPAARKPAPPHAVLLAGHVAVVRTVDHDGVPGVFSPVHGLDDPADVAVDLIDQTAVSGQTSWVLLGSQIVDAATLAPFSDRRVQSFQVLLWRRRQGRDPIVIVVEQVAGADQRIVRQDVAHDQAEGIRRAPVCEKLHRPVGNGAVEVIVAGTAVARNFNRVLGLSGGLVETPAENLGRNEPSTVTVEAMREGVQSG